jgi:hypothetical protein
MRTKAPGTDDRYGCPRVVRPTLDEHVAARMGSPHRPPAPNLAVQDDRVVERGHLVEPDVPRVAVLIAGGVVVRSADLAEHL